MRTRFRPRLAAALSLIVGVRLLSFAVPACPAPDAGQASMTRSEAISYFLLNCAYFGTWPSGAGWTKTRILRIGVLGKDPLGKDLDRVSERAKAVWLKDGKIEIVRGKTLDQVRSCHVVFVADQGFDRPESAVSACRGKPILLVSDSPGFAQRGGTVAVSIDDEKLSFDINLDALAEGKMRMRAGMLQRAAGFIRHGKRTDNPMRERS